MVQIGENFLLAIAAVATAWLLSRFVIEPTLIKRMQKAASERVVALGAGLAVLRTVRRGLTAALAAFTVAVGAAAALGIYINTLGKEAGTPALEAQSKLVAVRDLVERALEQTSVVSQSVWVFALCALALIWIALSYSYSRRRWTEAFEIRHSAVLKATNTLEREELDNELAQHDPAGAASLAREIEVLEKANRDRIAQIRSLQTISMGEQGQFSFSIDDLVRIKNDMLENEDRDDSEDGREDSEAAASRLADIVVEAERQIRVPLLKLGGGEREYPLNVAGEYCQADQADVIDRKRRALVSAKMQAHQADGAKMRVREPELISEWVGVAATGGATVKGMTAVGRTGGFVALVAFFLSLLGVSANALGPSVVLQAEAYEMDFVDAEASTAIASAKLAENEVQPVSDEDSRDLASDEATREYIRTSFRLAFATGLRQSLGVNSAVERAAFQLGAADTRRAILSSAARNAAPSAELGAVEAKQAFVATRSVDVAAVSDAERYLNSAIDRRIEQLRQRETLWARFRREALKPSAPNDAVEALLRTVLGDGAFPTEHSFRVAVDRSAGRFATEAARLGSVTKAKVAVSVSIDTPPSLMTIRDQRLVHDFQRSAPSYVQDAAVRLHSGDIDPGSLHRVPMGMAQGTSEVSPRAVRAAASNLYAELFPALAEGAGELGRAIGNSATPAARSFARIRFSGRVGGVVIGREPDPGGDVLNVISLDWRLTSENAYFLAITTADGLRVELGPYHPALIFGALAYAADGRVVTSTLPQPTGDRIEVDGIPLSARRVLVHPALEDTSVACPSIQIDRFVDNFTNPRSNAEVAIRLDEARNAVTVFGQLLTVLGSVPSYEREPQQSDIRDFLDARDDDIRTYASQCTAEDGTCFPVDYYKKFNLNFGNSDDVLRCIAGGGQCLDKVMGLQTDYGYLVDSGVREQGFKLDKDFKFLTGPTSDDALWPIDFIIQAVPQATNQEQQDVDADFDPWMFPAFADDIRAMVRSGIESDPGAKLVFNDMKDFVVLQRLFRLSLSGWLGFDFPVQRLADLETVTKPAMEVRRNERWNMNLSIQKILLAQAEALAGDLTKLSNDKAVSSVCHIAVDRALSAHQSSPWPEGVDLWPSVGAAGQACQAFPAGIDIEARLKRLRELDLVEDAIFFVQGGPALSCQPL